MMATKDISCSFNVMSAFPVQKKETLPETQLLECPQQVSILNSLQSVGDFQLLHYTFFLKELVTYNKTIKLVVIAYK